MSTTIVLSETHYLFRRLGELRAQELNLHPDDLVRIIIGPATVVTSSYLLGLLDGHIKKHGKDAKQLVEWVDPNPVHFGTIHRVTAMMQPASS